MGRRQVQEMLRLMAGGGPVEVASRMSSVKKLSQLAFTAQQFGYDYADVRHAGGRNSVLKMMIVPDPSPQARARAAQNWAQYPNAADGVSLPPMVPEALELLKLRLQFDLTGKLAQKRMGYGVLGATAASLVLAVRAGGETTDFVVAGVVWLVLMAVFAIGFVVTRARNAKFAARLQGLGFVPVTDQDGRVRYLTPAVAGAAGWAGVGAGAAPGVVPGPYGAQPDPASYVQPAASGAYGHPGAPAPYGAQASYGAQATYPAPGPYGAPQAPQAPGPYGAPQAPGPYAPPAYGYAQQPPSPSPQPPHAQG